MSKLEVSIIDVGWGDSIFIESVSNNGNIEYALIDSNDSQYLQSSYIFIKRLLELKVSRGIVLPDPLFKYIILSHVHLDHGQGLKKIISAYSCLSFFYPKSNNWGSLMTLLRYAKSSTKVNHHESVDTSKKLPNLGDATVEILWPEPDKIDNNENNNSIVLLIRLNNIIFLLSGDAEKEVWDKIAHKLPENITVFKVPHHGSRNGTFSDQGRTPWLDKLLGISPKTKLAISTHVRPFDHPHAIVIDKFNQMGYSNSLFRTDEHHHVTFTTDGNTLETKYAHR